LNRLSGISAAKVFLCFAATFFVVPTRASGSHLSRPFPQQSIQTTADLVKVDVSVADNRGNFIGGFTQSDFRILDTGVEQPIVFFAPVETPAQILVMIETGPAVYLIRGEHLSAAYALLNGLDPADQVALVSYDESPHQVLAFTTDRSPLLSALGQIQFNIGRGDLNFYDSLSIVLDWLKPVAGKCALVLLTTGLDSSPSARWDALVQKIRRDNVVIFPVALGGQLRGSPPAKVRRSNSSAGNDSSTNASQRDTLIGFAKADRDLRSLATLTGGRAYFPISQQDFLSVYREIASALRHQYVLGLIPAHDGQYHPLSLEIASRSTRTGKSAKKNSDYHVFARDGYLAPGP
jgi:VWFA-related protein